jgi:uncharacterized membrane protein YbhN (UPF0104 family)
LASVGVTIFAKYVPGKVWAVIGRAGYVGERTGYPLSRLSLSSLQAQLLMLWVGLPLGGLTFAFASEPDWRRLALVSLALWGLLSAVLASDAAGRILTWLQGRLRLETDAVRPVLSLRRLTGALPWFLPGWAAWCAGFALLVTALTGAPPEWSDGLAFVLATTLGVMAVIAPGGLGVREGLLVALLVMLGHTLEVATTLAVVARLWFLAGEALMFAAGILAGFASRRLHRPQG